MKLGPSIVKLLELASAPLNQAPPKGESTIFSLGGTIAEELMMALKLKNGFYAFESALHVLPAQSSLLSVGLDDWNDEKGWRLTYGKLANDCLFFAEDAFGGQFCISKGSLWAFDPETGDRDRMGSSLDEWAHLILSDYKVKTGQPLAHEWQAKHGVLAEGVRLVPKTPFVFNGDFSIENLVAMNAEQAMRARGNLATQIHDLPDGSEIRFQIEE